MTVATTAVGALLVAEAATYQGEQVKARVAAEEAILATFAALEMKDALTSWSSGIGERIYVLLSMLQQLIVQDSNRYVRRILRLQGLVAKGPPANPNALAGIASDMRDLESLLAGAVVKVRQAQREGLDDGEAFRRGENFLRLVTTTQAADTSRAAESVAMVAAAPVAAGNDAAPSEVTVGWVRMLNPPSCGRCAVLAGRFYRWSDGFERHDMCDCRHIPVSESLAGDLTVDPQAYFDSLSEPDQDYYFGKAVAQAIRDGADPAQVVNATSRKGAMFTADRGRRYTREGTTRSGFYGRGSKALRPTPWQIYQDAGGSREVAREMLARFGYIVQ